MAEVVNELSKRHSIKIVYNESVEVSGVENIVSYDSKNVVFKLSNNVLNLTGLNFDVRSLDLDQGKVVVSGRVNSLSYDTAREKVGFVKRLLK